MLKLSDFVATSQLLARLQTGQHHRLPRIFRVCSFGCQLTDLLVQVVLPQSINPILGSVEGWLIGVSLLPSGWMTYLGGAIVLVASAFVLVSSHFRTEVRLDPAHRSKVPCPCMPGSAVYE